MRLFGRILKIQGYIIKVKLAPPLPEVRLNTWWYAVEYAVRSIILKHALAEFLGSLTLLPI